MRTRLLLLAGCLVAHLGAPTSALAQDPAAQAEAAATLHLGPLGLAPTFTLGNIGIDTNVFNTSTDPTRDFTVSFLPQTDEVLPVGRLLFTGTTGVPLTYFQKATTQRSVGFLQKGRVELELVHLVPYASAAYVSSYAQPNDEIAVRVQQLTETGTVGSVINLGPRTSFDGSYTKGSVEFPNADVLGVDIGQQLDRHVTAFNGTFRRNLTPLTTFVVASTLERDRFDSNTVLNANSLSVLSGLEFKPDALVSGTFSLGVKAFRPLNPTVPRYTGIVGSSTLSVLVRDTTRLDGRFTRDLQYSIDEATPYYLLTGAAISVTQLVVGHVDVVAGVGRSYLTYRDLLAATGGPTTTGRTDRTNTFTVGTGYRFRSDARIGFNLAYVSRRSALDGLQYSGFQFGGTVSYGF